MPEVRQTLGLNQRSTIQGRKVKSATTAKSSVKLMRKPMWKVPRNDEEVSVMNPPQRIKLVTTMALPVAKNSA